MPHSISRVTTRAEFEKTGVRAASVKGTKAGACGSWTSTARGGKLERLAGGWAASRLRWRSASAARVRWERVA